jgi:N-formylmaleamate deformylase
MPDMWQDTYIDLDGARMHVTRTGNGSLPPMVLAHGFSDTGLCWQPTAEDLQAEYDVILPDARAHGLSARVQPGQVVDMPADLARMMSFLGVKKAVVGGHSMGAALTARLAARYPELVRALILEDPPWRQPASSSPFPGKSAENPLHDMMVELTSIPADQRLVRCRIDHPTWPEIILQRWNEGKSQLDLTHFDTRTADTTPWDQTLREITCPILLITADPSRGGIITPEVAQKAVELNPNLRLVNIPNAGHHIRFENYPAFMQAVRKFLAEAG